ncbi:MAG TPA: hypothetical protein VFP19_07305, partial [Candidatus Limnocylindrales bacterium]|nr:hypothetical protein [Candidatus Limnocylindrales bacterium]
MTRSLLAAWRVSLRRTRADLPIVAAAWLITLIAAVLLAAGPIYASAAALAGLHQTLTEAPAADTGVVVSLYGKPAHVSEIDGRVVEQLHGAMAPLGGSVIRDTRNSGGLTFQNPPAAGTDAVPLLGFRDGLPDHATLAAGSWPADRVGSGPIPVAVLDAVATEL